MLSTCGRDDLLQSVFVVIETLTQLGSESFSPLSIRILVDLDTLPIILRFGIKLDTDFHHRGHPRPNALRPTVVFRRIESCDIFICLYQ